MPTGSTYATKLRPSHNPMTPTAAASTPPAILVLRSTARPPFVPAAANAASYPLQGCRQLRQLDDNQDAHVDRPQCQHQLLQRPPVNQRRRAGGDGQVYGVVLHSRDPSRHGRLRSVGMKKAPRGGTEIPPTTRRIENRYC